MAHLASHIQNYEVRFLPGFFDSRSNWTDFRVELFAMACSNAAAELLGEAEMDASQKRKKERWLFPFYFSWRACWRQKGCCPCVRIFP
ncbi:protein ROOT HAIR DEFECTIVE 3 2-like [Pyrus ussuriensis x Pyrus communis]|uniref:Protein ROOT HAIR DEFECTIVE 3 2-like n=1 Tax=Pyrus ussuriensis x Pyrus communis TaxID=2448454 RepID=A0A5N5IB95_9ROSA|nr:protein ROOT HAIR DEFECTIVE 3 2-like [Pyrus ussuriensis x Pyrus communis]